MMTYGVLNNREDTDFGIVLETNDARWRHPHFVNMAAHKPALSTARRLWICRLWFLYP